MKTGNCHHAVICSSPCNCYNILRFSESYSLGFDFSLKLFSSNSEALLESLEDMFSRYW